MLKELDREYLKKHPIIVGVDEVGRGCLAGGVTAAAVAINSHFIDPGVRDSKKISAKKRESFSAYIKQHCLAYSVNTVDVDTVDQINILRAALLAMENAVKSVCGQITPDLLLIDGKFKIESDFDQETIIGGDDKSTAIGAASIIAKVERDSMMFNVNDAYPEYDFNSNKGYGTPSHRKAIAQYGITPIHRKTFKGVKEFVL